MNHKWNKNSGQIDTKDMDMHYGTIKSREIDNQINRNPCCNLTSDQRTFAEWLFAHDVRDSLGARRFQKHSAVQKNGARFEIALYFEVQEPSSSKVLPF